MWILRKCSTAGHSPKWSYFEILTYFWLLSTEVALLYSLYRSFPAGVLWKPHRLCSELGIYHHPHRGFPALALLEETSLLLFLEQSPCFLFFSLLPCFSLEEHKPWYLRLASPSSCFLAMEGMRPFSPLSFCGPPSTPRPHQHTF